jgi:hypothetical protein
MPAFHPDGCRYAAGTSSSICSGTEEVLQVVVAAARVAADAYTALIHLAQHPTDLAPISNAVDQLTDPLHSHFAYEERELVGPLAQYGFYPGQV